MSGIYIHIPFCKSRCIYCDFYSTTLSGNRILYVDNLIDEAIERKSFLDAKNPVKTIYIGGGTPSQLPVSEITRLAETLNKSFTLDHLEEFTLEVNPEDVTAEFVAALPGQINRVSMGVQSFIDAELQTINRRHNSQKPAEAVRLLREKGISNISIDLMYGLPGQTLSSFGESIDHAIALDVPHISAYNLSVEEGTRLAKLIDEGELSVADDELCLAMAALLRQKLTEAGYVQYEISNFAKPGFESKHNSSYWTGEPYLGLGPGAHSYDGHHLRCWNDHDLHSYLNGNRKWDSETLTDTDIHNERIMLGLRTRQGFSRTSLLLPLDEDVVRSLKNRDLIKEQNLRISLTQKGLALADEVIRELIRIDE